MVCYGGAAWLSHASIRELPPTVSACFVGMSCHVCTHTHTPTDRGINLYTTRLCFPKSPLVLRIVQ